MYRYGMRLRPVGLGCQPKGFDRFDNSEKWLTGYYGYVWYSRKLSDEELEMFDMDFLEKCV